MMTQQINKQVFTYARQFADNALKSHAITLNGLEQVVDLQLKVLEKQASDTTDFVTQAAEVRDLAAFRDLWEKGVNLSRHHIEQMVSVSRDILAVNQKTAESLSALAQAQQQAANEAVSTNPVIQKVAAASGSATASGKV